MTALDKMLAAMDADVVPAAGTYKDALAELDAIIAGSWEHLRDVCALRGKIESFAGIGAVLRQANRSKAAEAASTPLVAVPESPTLCSVCQRRPARVWDEGDPYCKRCAREAGVVVHGKIT
jgi:hypothetical protein